MPDINKVHGIRAVAQLAGALTMLADGVLVFPMTAPALFTARDWWGIIIVAAMLAIIPLSPVALFKPRFAAYGAALIWLIFSAPNLMLFVSDSGEKLDHGGLRLYFYVTGPLLISSALLFYASTAHPRKSTSG